MKLITKNLTHFVPRPPRLQAALLVAAIAAVLISFIPTSPALSADPSPTGQSGRWHVLFSDDFTDTTLDTSKWTTCYPSMPPEGCSHGPELQWYQPQNVSLSDGRLHLTARREQVVGDGRGYDYTSGMVTTTGKFNFQYGYAEIRAKLTRGQGMWPAFWMLPADDTWPPEIDIMEHLGHEPNRAHMGLHWGTREQQQNAGTSFVGPDFSADYHTFAVDWQADALIYYVDGVERYRYTDAANIPKQPFYLLANLAVGGPWPGPPDASTVFPQSMAIDYIRVWQREPMPTVQSLAASGSFAPGAQTTLTTTLQISQPLTVNKLKIAVRNAAGTNMDTSAKTNVTLSGSQQHSFAKSFPAGVYTYWVTYEKDGQWIELQPKKIFTVGSQNGLSATYYNNKDLTGSSVPRIDATVNFDWWAAAPVSGIDPETFSVEWTGSVQAPSTGTYTFYTQSDDGVRLWVDNKLLVDNWTDHSSTENSNTINLVAGKKYSIRMQFYDNTWDATARLSWKTPGSGSKTIIPQNRLFTR